MQIGGIVLCGGQSQRMGQPKAWLPFGEERMLPRIVRIVTEVVSPVVVVAAPGQAIPPLPDSVLICRDEQEKRGPLQGLLAGLLALQGQCDAVYLSSCDVPFLKTSFIQRMIDLLGDHSIVVPEVDGYFHPLAAVYRLDVLPVIQRLLKEDRLRPVFLFDEVPTRKVKQEDLQEADPELKSLWNLNTPEEYALALEAFPS